MTKFTTTHNLSLSQAKWIYTTPSQPISWKSVLYYLPFFAQILHVISFLHVFSVTHCIYLCSFTIPKSHFSHCTYLLTFIQGHLKWVGAQVKKNFGPPIKDGPTEILHASFVLMSKKYLVCSALTVCCRATCVWSKTILRRKTETYET